MTGIHVSLQRNSPTALLGMSGSLGSRSDSLRVGHPTVRKFKVQSAFRLAFSLCWVAFFLAGCGGTVKVIAPATTSSTAVTSQASAEVASSFTVSSTSLSFGSVALNSPSTQSLALVSSSSVALTISAGTVTGAGFSLPAATFPVTLGPGETQVLNVEFTPTAAGAATGLLTISTNAANQAAVAVPLSGTGATPEVELSWAAPLDSNDPVAGYNLYRAAPDSASFQLLNATVISSTSYVDSAVQSGQTYDYVVVSVDDSGLESPPSNVFTISTP